MKIKSRSTWNVRIIPVLLCCTAAIASAANVALYTFEGNYNDTSGFGTALNMAPTVNGTPPTLVNETAPWIKSFVNGAVDGTAGSPGGYHLSPGGRYVG